MPSHCALKESLDNTKSRSKHWEQKAKEGTKRIKGIEKLIYKAKEEA